MMREESVHHGDNNINDDERDYGPGQGSMRLVDEEGMRRREVSVPH